MYQSRLHELEASLLARDEQLRQLQSSSWGSWAEDQSITAELSRLQSELSQAHALHRQLESRLNESEHARQEEGKAAEASVTSLTHQLMGVTAERDGAVSRVASLAAEVAETKADLQEERGEVAARRAAEAGLRDDLSDRDAQLRVAHAQLETMEDEIVGLRCAAAAALTPLPPPP